MHRYKFENQEFSMAGLCQHGVRKLVSAKCAKCKMHFMQNALYEHKAVQK